MIKAQELRIGNWLNVEGAPMKVFFIRLAKNDTQAIHFENEETNDHPISGRDINPIPLTPELLEKCGADYSGDDGLFIRLRGASLLIDNAKQGQHYIEIENEEPPYGSLYLKIPMVQSLHQLQNLYYALTGEELQINL